MYAPKTFTQIETSEFTAIRFVGSNLRAVYDFIYVTPWKNYFTPTFEHIQKRVEKGGSVLTIISRDECFEATEGDWIVRDVVGRVHIYPDAEFQLLFKEVNQEQ